MWGSGYYGGCYPYWAYEPLYGCYSYPGYCYGGYPFYGGYYPGGYYGGYGGGWGALGLGMGLGAALCMPAFGWTSHQRSTGYPSHGLVVPGLMPQKSYNKKQSEYDLKLKT
uniref:Uncharacterized protein n=1 Tax=Romanomermis culicivorax TaxID=13658 RepID=A0A915IYY6_ROMCU